MTQIELEALIESLVALYWLLDRLTPPLLQRPSELHLNVFLENLQMRWVKDLVDLLSLHCFIHPIRGKGALEHLEKHSLLGLLGELGRLLLSGDH